MNLFKRVLNGCARAAQRGKLLVLTGIAFVALGSSRALAVTDFDDLVTGAQAKITSMTVPITTIFVALLTIAAVVAIGSWLLHAVKRR